MERTMCSMKRLVRVVSLLVMANCLVVRGQLPVLSASSDPNRAGLPVPGRGMGAGAAGAEGALNPDAPSVQVLFGGETRPKLRSTLAGTFLLNRSLMQSMGMQSMGMQSM